MNEQSLVHVPDHGTQYKETPSSHHNDGLTDGLDPFLFSRFHLGRAGKVSTNCAKTKNALKDIKMLLC